MSSRRPENSLEHHPLLEDHPAVLRWSLILWGLGLALFVAMAVPVLTDWVQRVDDAVYDFVVGIEIGWLVRIAEALDFIGSVWVTLPVMVGIGLYLIAMRRWRGLAYWAISMAASQLLIGPVKNIYERERPPDALVETTSFSFPSGHAVAGAAIAISLVIVLVPAGPKRRNLEILAVGFAVVMALSRVYLRAHWLSDVLAGAALGAAVAVGAAVVLHMVDSRRVE